MPLHAASLPSDPATLAAGRQWRNLLHYKRGWLRGTRSQATSPEFFLSPEGRGDPEAELRAELGAMARSEPGGDRHPRCLFPARARFLREKAGLADSPAPCPEFEAWRAKFHAKGLTLVFASSFLENPASMFGHPMIRVDSDPDAGGPKSRLLDYGISFAADSRDANPLKLVVYGLFGWFPGVFTMQPYFERVKGYNDMESRGLWEFRLSLGPEHAARLVEHLWELQRSDFDYLFFDENCASYLLSLLEIANPDWELTDRFFYYVIPSDVVRSVAAVSGAIAGVRYRESLRQIIDRRLEAMSESDLSAFDGAREGFRPRGGENAAVLDALIDYQQYQVMGEQRAYNEEERAVQREILLARAAAVESPGGFSAGAEAGEVGRASPTAQGPGVTPRNAEPRGAVAVPAEILARHSRERPDLGHESAKLGLEGGYSGAFGDWYGLTGRAAYHDLLDDDLGYRRGARVHAFTYAIRWLRARGAARLQELLIADVIALSPWNRLSRGWSWTLSSGLRAPRDQSCETCIAGLVRAGGGASWEVGGWIPFAMLVGNIEIGGAFSHFSRFGPSLWTGVVGQLGPGKLGLEGELLYYPDQDWRRLAYARFAAEYALPVGARWEARARAGWLGAGPPASGEISALVSRYF